MQGSSELLLAWQERFHERGQLTVDKTNELLIPAKPSKIVRKFLKWKKKKKKKIQSYFLCRIAFGVSQESKNENELHLNSGHDSVNSRCDLQWERTVLKNSGGQTYDGLIYCLQKAGKNKYSDYLWSMMKCLEMSANCFVSRKTVYLSIFFLWRKF